jgi:hypothetical protein
MVHATIAQRHARHGQQCPLPPTVLRIWKHVLTFSCAPHWMHTRWQTLWCAFSMDTGREAPQPSLQHTATASCPSCECRASSSSCSSLATCSLAAWSWAA